MSVICKEQITTNSLYLSTFEDINPSEEGMFHLSKAELKVLKTKKIKYVAEAAYEAKNLVDILGRDLAQKVSGLMRRNGLDFDVISAGVSPEYRASRIELKTAATRLTQVTELKKAGRELLNTIGESIVDVETNATASRKYDELFVIAAHHQTLLKSNRDLTDETKATLIQFAPKACVAIPYLVSQVPETQEAGYRTLRDLIGPTNTNIIKSSPELQQKLLTLLSVELAFQSAYQRTEAAFRDNGLALPAKTAVMKTAAALTL